MKEATAAIPGLGVVQLEGALAGIAAGGNASTLLFAATQAKAPVFYDLKPAQVEALKDLPGAFPNLPAYFGAVMPDKGFPELKKLYAARSDMGLPILRAVGTTQLPEAKAWLIQEACALKKAGRDAYPAMAGLSRCAGDTALTGEELGRLFDLSLNREELLLLAKAPVKLNGGELEALLDKGGAAAAFGREQMLRNPAANAELLCARVERHLDQGHLQEASVLLHSDTVRAITDEALVARLDILRKRLSDLQGASRKP